MKSFITSGSGTLANSKDPDEFHPALLCLRRHKPSSAKEIQYYLESLSYDPSIYTMDQSDFLRKLSLVCDGLIRFTYIETVHVIMKLFLPVLGQGSKYRLL